MTVQTRSVARDEYGAESETWQDDFSVWARKNEMPGAERIEASQIDATLPVEFTIRHRVDVTPRNRLRYGADIFQIHSVAEIGRKEGLTLICSREDD